MQMNLKNELCNQQCIERSITTSQNTKKCYFIGLMCNKLVKTIIGLYEEDDRDSYANKRIETTGYLMANLISMFKQNCKRYKIVLNREISSEIGMIQKITMKLSMK